jgi:hypothetical protein
MLHKCANPECPTLFRKMSAGRLFQLPKRAQNGDGTSRHSGRGVAYFWLCGDCSAHLTLTQDPETDVIVMPIRAVLGNSSINASRGSSGLGELR